MAASFFLVVSVLLTTLLCHHAAAEPPTQDMGCVHLPVVHSTNVKHFPRKRGVQLRLANRTDVAYYAQLSIGTPPQRVFVQLDTGSFELWVNPDCSAVSGADATFCRMVGHYDTAKSSTAKSLSTTKTLRYGIGSANITYFADTIALAGSPTALQAVQFGVATATQDAFSGILGIGYGQGVGTRYPNFVDQLQAQNATRVKAYTLALGSKEAQEGVIVFGGVDTSKFAGQLVKLPILPTDQSPDGVPRFWVNMQSVSITPPNGVSRAYGASNMPVFLDSGSTMTLLPSNLTNAIARDFGAKAPGGNGFFEVDCSLARLNGSVNFAFGGVTVKVPYKELIREVPGNPPACFLGVMRSDQFTLLGDTFLRSAYTVFDLESNSVWMAQAASCGSTPAALNRVQDLAAVTGRCRMTELVVNNTSSGTATTPVPGAGTEGTNVAPATTTASRPAAGTSRQSGAKPSSTDSTTSWASSCLHGGVGITWSLGMAMVLHLFVGAS